MVRALSNSRRARSISSNLHHSTRGTNSARALHARDCLIRCSDNNQGRAAACRWYTRARDDKIVSSEILSSRILGWRMRARCTSNAYGGGDPVRMCEVAAAMMRRDAIVRNVSRLKWNDTDDF